MSPRHPLTNSLDSHALALLPTIVTLAQGAGATGLTGKVFLTRLGLEFGGHSQQVGLRRLSDLATSQLAVHVSLALRFLVRNKLLYIPASPSPIPRPILDETFVSVEFKRIQRYCCGRWGDSSWRLVGGGYDVKHRAFVATMRDALCIAICEQCFRERFLRAPAAAVDDANEEESPIPVGIAILPEVGPRHQGSEFLNWVVTYVQRSINQGNVPTESTLCKMIRDVDESVMRGVVSGLVRTNRLYRAVAIDSRTGRTHAWLTSSPPATHEILHVRWAKPLQLDDLYGFHGTTTLVQIQVGQVCVVRTVDHIRWLRDALQKELPPTIMTLPALPLDRYLGRFNAYFLDMRLDQVTTFLERVVLDRRINNLKPVAAFFRKDFDGARAAVDASWLCATPRGRCPSHVLKRIEAQKQRRVLVRHVGTTTSHQLDAFANELNEFQRGETRSSLGDAFLQLDNFELLQTEEDCGIEPVALSCCEFEVIKEEDYCGGGDHGGEESSGMNNILASFAEQQAARAAREVVRWKRALDFWQA